MIGQATIKRRDMLLVASSMLAATVVAPMPAVAQSQTPARPKSETLGGGELRRVRTARR